MSRIEISIGVLAVDDPAVAAQLESRLAALARSGALDRAVPRTVPALTAELRRPASARDIGDAVAGAVRRGAAP